MGGILFKRPETKRTFVRRGCHGSKTKPEIARLGRLVSQICVAAVVGANRDWLHSLRKMMSAIMSSANPTPKIDPARRSLKTSNPCSVATRGLSMLLMNGGNAHAITNTPPKKNALRLRAALSAPGVRSESFGTPPAYRALSTHHKCHLPLRCVTFWMLDHIRHPATLHGH